MKNYFSWTRLGSSAAVSTRNEQPLMPGVVMGPQPSSIVATVLEPEHLAPVPPRVGTDMVVRTISVCTPRQETVDAALICSFAVPTEGMNYLAYSLNESMGDESVRVYIAVLQCERGRYSLAPSIADHAWQQAFGEIIDHGQGGQSASWHYINIGQEPLPVTLCQEHASIQVNKASIMSLLFCLGGADMGRAIEHLPVANTYSNERANSTADTTQDFSQLARFCELGDEQDEQLDEVQASLSSLVAMAQELELRHNISIREYQQLDERQIQLSELERELNGKSKDLANRYAALLDSEARAADLQTRLRLLDEREAALKIRSQELALGHQKLSANRARFSSIVKKFHVAVQLKGVAHQSIKEFQVQQKAG